MVMTITYLSRWNTLYCRKFKKNGKKSKWLEGKRLEEKNILLTLAYIRVRELKSEIDRNKLLLEALKRKPIEDDIIQFRSDIEMRMKSSAIKFVEYTKLKKQGQDILDAKKKRLTDLKYFTGILKRQNDSLLRSLREFESDYCEKSLLSRLASIFCCMRTKSLV